MLGALHKPTRLYTTLRFRPSPLPTATPVTTKHSSNHYDHNHKHITAHSAKPPLSTTVPANPTTTHLRQLTIMADDTSYSTFLSKANEDPYSGARPGDIHQSSTSQARSKFDPSTQSGKQSGIPTSLQNLPDTPYVSETDSDWEPVFFNYAADSPPTLEQFKQVLRAKNGFGENGASEQSVQEFSLREFDPRGQYEEIVERVREVARETGEGNRGNLSGDQGGEVVKVFRVEVSRTRIEYYVLTVGERKLVGVVAKAVES